MREGKDMKSMLFSKLCIGLIAAAAGLLGVYFAFPSVPQAVEEGTPAPTEPPPPFQFVAQKEAYIYGDPIYLQLRLRNDRDQPLYCWDLRPMHDSYTRLKFEVKDGQGKVIQDVPRIRRKPDSGMEICRTVDPGKTLIESICLNMWYTFPGPGQYVVACHLVSPPPAITLRPPIPSHTLTEEEVVQDQISNEVEITIGPRDAEKLEALCRTLLPKALNPRLPDDERFLAAQALSYVTDEVAVPYLIEVVEKSRAAKLTDDPGSLALRATLTSSWTAALEGLGRIGNQAAQEALERYMQAPYPVVSWKAWKALKDARKRQNLPLPPPPPGFDED
jgi:hypothetical protein